MKFLDNFLNKQSLKVKSKGLNYLTSVFDNIGGLVNRRNDAGGSNIAQLYSIAFAFIIGMTVITSVSDLVGKVLPYAIGALVVLIIILRKQLQVFVGKIINRGSVKENIPNPIQKLKQELVDDKDSYAKGVVINARLEEIPKKDRRVVKEGRRGFKVAHVEQIEEIVATITVQKGKLEIGDALKAYYSIWGWHDCKVSRIYNENGEKVKFAEAGQTVSITGFYKLFSTKNIDITRNPINGKKFEAYDDRLGDGYEGDGYE